MRRIVVILVVIALMVCAVSCEKSDDVSASDGMKTVSPNENVNSGISIDGAVDDAGGGAGSDTDMADEMGD